VWDFPLVNIAAAIKVEGGTITASRFVVNAVAARPLRLTAVEDAVAYKPRNEETAAIAGAVAVEGARPLAHNGYKIPLVRNLVKRAIRGEAQA
jgi:xanthine dehydrogenase YagS FAD-binding subunit